ncbi:serine/threonine-protein kinase [Reyranella sp. CPCC 100927]|uniref:serine/threonine-protein kinase n=1 Tax=Reyranella sp. CPCC 100927 TaxID=2599616 RepID=UPI0015B59CA1|nr:serine/threonine-protein kinase [Reyranella sp. CPCC 100927]
MAETLGAVQHDGDVDDVKALPVGTRIGSHEIVAVLAHNDGGITYRARDTQANRDVTLKEYLPTALARRAEGTQVLPRAGRATQDFQRGRDRFLAEAEALTRLQDVADIETVHEVLKGNDTVYAVTAPVPGEALAARLQRDRRLSRLAIDRIVAPLLDGLERAHAAGCLHLDIRPATILIDRTDHPTLIDFAAWRVGLRGVAREAPSAYVPPEMTASAQPGPWTDIYALGATLYHGVTGASPPAAAARLKQDTLEPATRAAMGHYAPALLAFIDAALRLREAERPQSVTDWRRMLLAAPTPPARTNNRAHARTGPSRRRPAQARLWPAVSLLMISLIGGVGYLWYSAEDEAARAAAAAKAAADAAVKQRAQEKATQEAQERARLAAAGWSELQNSTDPAPLRAFAARFTGTPEARLAQQRADALDAAARRRAEEEAARRAAEAAQEKARVVAAAWADVQGSEDPARLRAFAERFAGTPEAQQATARADQIEAAAKRQADEEAKRRAAEAAREKARAATTQWPELQNSEDVARLQQFATDFAGTPEGRLALNRADELKAAQEQARSRSEKAPDRAPETREGPRSFTYPDGSRYVGTLSNGKRNGQGTYTYANGDRYVGAWQNDDMHGQGVYTFADGGRYTGEWRNDKMHGHGVRTWPDGDRYDGAWRAGKKHGSGTYAFNSGDRYVGDWVDDAMQGRGIYTWKDGGRYEGEWRDDKQNGHGVRVFSDGVRYEGEWKDDQAHGQGMRRDPDGDVFTGRWQNGCFMDGDRAVAVGTDLEDCKR